MQIQYIFQGTLRTIESFLYDDYNQTPSSSRLPLNPNTKILIMLVMIICSALVHNPLILAGNYGVIFILSVVSGIPVKKLFSIILVLPFFALWIALPMLFTVYPADTGIISMSYIPAYISISAVLRTATFLLRIIVSVTSVVYVIRTTPWNMILQSLHGLYVPHVFIAILAMTYRYIYVLLTITSSMLRARESRTFGTFSHKESYRLITGILAELFTKSISISDRVYLAMISRGYHGVELSMETNEFTDRDVLFVGATCFYGILTIFLQQKII